MTDDLERRINQALGGAERQVQVSASGAADIMATVGRRNRQRGAALGFAGLLIVAGGVFGVAQSTFDSSRDEETAQIVIFEDPTATAEAPTQPAVDAGTADGTTPDQDSAADTSDEADPTEAEFSLPGLADLDAADAPEPTQPTATAASTPKPAATQVPVIAPKPTATQVPASVPAPSVPQATPRPTLTPVPPTHTPVPSTAVPAGTVEDSTVATDPPATETPTTRVPSPTPTPTVGLALTGPGEPAPTATPGSSTDLTPTSEPAPVVVAAVPTSAVPTSTVPTSAVPTSAVPTTASPLPTATAPALALTDPGVAPVPDPDIPRPSTVQISGTVTSTSGGSLPYGQVYSAIGDASIGGGGSYTVDAPGELSTLSWNGGGADFVLGVFSGQIDFSTVSTVNVVIASPTTVTVSVVDENGAPLAGVPVMTSGALSASQVSGIPLSSGFWAAESTTGGNGQTTLSMFGPAAVQTSLATGVWSATWDGASSSVTIVVTGDPSSPVPSF